MSKLKSNNNRAKYYFLKGKALNILDDYDKLAEEYLSKALKLDPNQIECWNELGECYWKKSDSEEAKNCFTAALNYVYIYAEFFLIILKIEIFIG